MGFSITQQKYNDYFIFRANTLVNNLFNAITSSANWQDELETVLGAVEASFVIMQLSEGGYRFIAKPEEGCSAESIMTPEI